MKPFCTATVYAVLLLALSNTGSGQSKIDIVKQVPSPEGVGLPSVFLKNYEAFRSNQLRSGSPDVLTISLGMTNGHSRSFTAMAGSLSINLASGKYSVELTRRATRASYFVWLIDQGDPENLLDDRSFLLTSISPTNLTGKTEGLLDDSVLAFSIDKVVVNDNPKSADKILASGSIGVLQKMFFGSGALTLRGVRVTEGALLTRPLRFASLVPEITLEPTPTSVEASSLSVAATAAVAAASDKNLIQKGAVLFFEGTFKGNGRTCGTCHPAHNNLTIDAAFMATLPSTDPLFIAENNTVLAGLEKPLLMRQFGLILENLDGLDAPTTKFVMRSVPHALGMTVSLIKDTSQLPTPAQMTGWGGDGAPGTGSLRDFATGAVTQHFTKRLARVPGTDFDLPKEKDLDAMEAFQLSLGRTADFDLAKLTFQNAHVETGKVLFVNGSGNPAGSQNCNVCHANAGAIAANGLNRNFNTNVEDRVHPARSVQPFPIDAGFGLTPNPDGSFGNRAFNTPSVVEAADTAPFFHNNIVGTLEAAVTFYTGPEFSAPREPAGRFVFTPLQISQVANFLRGINTLQNIDIARRELEEVLAVNGNSPKEIDGRLATAFNESGDVIRVLTEGNIFPAAKNSVTSARQLILQAQQTNNPNQRAPIVQAAINTLQTARGQVAIVLP